MPQWLARISTCSSAHGIEAGAPVDDAVAARVDGHEPDPGRQRRSEGRPEAGAAVAVEAGPLEEAGRAEGAEPADGLDLESHERVDGQRIDVRRAERDESADQVRPARGEHLGEAAAAALARSRRPACPARPPRGRAAAPGAPERRRSIRRWRACRLWPGGSRPAAASRPSSRASRRRRGSRGSGATGRPRPSSRPSPRRIGSRSSAAASSPKRASRQSGGREPRVMSDAAVIADKTT